MTHSPENATEAHLGPAKQILQLVDDAMERLEQSLHTKPTTHSPTQEAPQETLTHGKNTISILTTPASTTGDKLTLSTTASSQPTSS
eukprot:CAMPEP_0201485018 /NCGR_PEP_ID=MMETSP0151_2-20130828/9162_1 /ASSEMBLY_ACC=CAM_ASM_000257 /TAXON_ID=200890 /ORGANISM="Paramoeba atlantica, Strain 621/1 / CCAP 1560/9" /LENGTH=86 /DNA_ID=CAMNT_0047868959 /DNA_START=32 /DNA_END=288 /DNA_ORIENTATION=+